MIKELIKLANHLDAKGYHKEADYIDEQIRKQAFPWVEFIAALLTPNETASRNSCNNCVNWPIELAQSYVDVKSYATERGWAKFPDSLVQLIEEYRDCCPWDYNLSDDENYELKSSESRKISFKIRLGRLTVEDPEVMKISHAYIGRQREQEEQRVRSEHRAQIGTSVPDESYYAGPKGLERAKRDWENIGEDQKINTARAIAPGTQWNNIFEPPPDDMVVDAVMHAMRQGEDALVQTYGLGLSE